MAKIDYINKWRAEYLKGRKDAFVQKFEAKSEEKQYSAISMWKSYRLRKSGKSKSKKSNREPARCVTMALRALKNSRGMAIAEIESLRKRIKALSDYCDNYEQGQKVQLKKDLEARLSTVDSKAEREKESLKRKIAELSKENA